jgi:DNA gyrase/topoisomerase IV subunit B
MNIDLSEYRLVKPESIIKKDEILTMYDIEVEDDKTFFIYGNNDLILTHNCDGNSISALLINFFYKFWPELFEQKMIYKVETPIVVSVAKKGKKKLYFYTQTEYNNWLEKINPKDWDIEYKKGLASLIDDEYDQIINQPNLTLISPDDTSLEQLKIWFGDNSDLRKNELTK